MAVLEKIRVKFGILITVLIGVALLSFIVDPSTLETTLRYFSSKYDVGKIGGNRISYEEYQSKLDYYTKVYNLTTGNQAVSESAMENLKETAWQSLISDLYIIPQMESAGIAVGEEELIDMSQGKEISPVIAQDPIFMDATGNFSREQLLEFIQSIPTDASGNLAMYWDFLQTNMTNQQYFTKYTSLISQSNIITPVELRRMVEENNTTSDVNFVMVPFGFKTDTTIVVTDKEIKDYYNAHKENYKQKASRDVEFVAFEVVPSEKDIKDAENRINKLYDEFASTDNLRNFIARNSDRSLENRYYKQGEFKDFDGVDEFLFSKNPTVLPVAKKGNTFYAVRVNDVKQMSDSAKVNHILLPAGSEQLADSLITVLKKGGDFSELAAMHSLDQNPNAPVPGELGWMTQSYMLPGLEKVLTMDVNKIEKINTNYGLHIVKVSERTKPMKKVQPAILAVEAQASKDTYQEFYAKANTLASKAEGKIDTFNAVAKEEGHRVVPANNVAEGANSLSKYRNTKEISRWIYEAKEGEVSPIITVDNNIFFVVALKTIKEEGYTPISKVSGNIKFQLTNKKRQEKMTAQVAEDIKGMTDLNQIAEKLGQSVVTREDIAFGSMTSNSTEPALIGAVAGASLNKVTGPVAGNIGVYVLDVFNRETGAFYTEDEAKVRQSQVTNYQINNLSSIFVKEADVVDNRARFF